MTPVDGSPVLGHRIRGIREERGENREVVAVRAGVSLSTLQRAEDGEPGTTFRTLSRIAQALEVNVAEIYTGPLAGIDRDDPTPPLWAQRMLEQITTALEDIRKSQRDTQRTLARIERTRT